MLGAILAADWSAIDNRLAALGSTTLPLRLLRGHSQLATGHSKEALCSFAGAVETADRNAWLAWTADLEAAHPHTALPAYLHGDALARIENWPGALAAFSRALAVAPGDPLVLDARAMANAASGDWIHARSDLLAATKATAAPVDVRVNLGVLAVLRRSDPLVAADDFKKALAEVPGHPIALLGLGVSAVAERDWQSARSYYLQAADAAPCIPLALDDLVLAQQAELADKRAAARTLADATPGTTINRTLENNLSTLDHKIGSVAHDLGMTNNQSANDLKTVTDKLSNAMSWMKNVTALESGMKTGLDFVAGRSLGHGDFVGAGIAGGGSLLLKGMIQQNNDALNTADNMLKRLQSFAPTPGGVKTEAQADAWDRGDWPAAIWPVLLYHINPSAVR